MTSEPFTSNKPYLFRSIYQWIVDNDATPYILVDANWPAVTIPRQFVEQGKITLNAAPEAVDNWFADNDGVSFSARFSGKSKDIYLPMASILAIYAQENNQGMAFEALQPQSEEVSLAGKSSTLREEKKSHKTVEESVITANKSATTKQSKAHLKLIK